MGKKFLPEFGELRKIKSKCMREIEKMNTAQVSEAQLESTRIEGARIESEVLRRLADVTQAHAAACMGVSASTVSRMVEDIGRLSQLLAAIGMQVAASNSIVVSREDLTALERFAFNYLKIKLAQEGAA